MASVQELLLAAQAKKSPFISLLEGAAQGFGKAQDQGLERTKQLMIMDQMRQEQEQKAQAQAAFRARIAAQTEERTQRAFKAAGGPGQPVLPVQKMTEKFSQDAKGDYSSDITVVDTTPQDQSFGTEKYVDAQGQTRIGRFNKATGDIEQRPNDPIAPAAGATDKSMARAITKAKVNLATTRPMVNSVISEIERVEKLNKGSLGGTTGALSMKARRATGIGDESQRFKNTADVINTMQSQVSKVLKSTFGGQLSDGEREYLNGVYGALPSLSVTERAIAMKNVKSMLKAKLEGDQATLNELLSDAGIEPDAEPTQGNETPEQRKARLLEELEESE